MTGALYFNMVEQDHPLSGSSPYLLKRWKKYTIYSKSGSYKRTTYVRSGSYGWDGKSNTSEPYKTNFPGQGTYIRESSPQGENLYQTNSIYLYDYIVVSKNFYSSIVYTASVIDSTPSIDSDWVAGSTWRHYKDTFRNSPNTIVSNYIWRYNPNASIVAGHDVYGDNPSIYVDPNSYYNLLMASPIYRDDGTYFEIVKGYPRNHFTHKRDLFSLFKVQTLEKVDGIISEGVYLRNRQTITTTIGEDSLEDGSSPVETTQVGNLNLIQSDNVINK